MVERRPLFREYRATRARQNRLGKSPSGSGVALQLALTAHQFVRRCEGVRILGNIAPLQEAFFLSLQLLDMSHRRWSPRNASVALEFADKHSLAAAAFVTSIPERGLDVARLRRSSSIHCRLALDLRNQCALYPACSQLLHPASTDFGPTTS